MIQTLGRIRMRATELLKNKYYTLVLLLTAVCSYGFLITHSTVGIDDTPYSYYFEEGLVAIVGRWVLFLLNKAVDIAEYAPFVTDFAGVLILMAAVTVWAALLLEIFGDRLPVYVYIGFSAVFLSSPIISEVYTYHLHNGISIGYLCCGISLWFLREVMVRFQNIKGVASALPSFMGACVFLWIAIGCYESMMIVWLLGVCLVLLSERYAGIKRNILKTFVTALACALLGIIMRSLMIQAVTSVFGLGYMKDEAVQRGIGEMLAWMFETGAGAEFAMALKRMLVMYGVFAYAYYPIRIFVFAVFIMAAVSILEDIYRRDVWKLILTVCSIMVCFLLVVVEGEATLYRAAQFLPVICGYGIFLMMRTFALICDKLRCSVSKIAPAALRIASFIPCLLLAVILWNQCADMNRWFYIDYVKYENACSFADNIYKDLKESFDTSKPVVFTGNYNIPQSIVQDAYVEYGSSTFYKINNITTKIDEHLLEKFYRPYGVWVAQTPSLSVIDWGRYAFDDDSELIKFFNMLGYDLVPLKDTDYAPIEEYSMELPDYPAEGSIVDMGSYIIVHF
jgi:hypothetical protein